MDGLQYFVGEFSVLIHFRQIKLNTFVTHSEQSKQLEPTIYDVFCICLKKLVIEPST